MEGGISYTKCKRQQTRQMRGKVRTTMFTLCRMAILLYMFILFIYTIISVIVESLNAPAIPPPEKEDEMFDRLGIFDNISDLDYSKNGCQLITPSSDMLIRKPKCSKNYELLILVTSDLPNFIRRMSIRNTWGSHKSSLKTYFLVGRSHEQSNMETLSCEYGKHADIIFTDVYENFYNLTYKVQTGFDWAVRYCNFSYLLKADDDVFINIPLLGDFLKHNDTPRSELFAGNVHYEGHVLRSGKYGVRKVEYWKNIYPRYCSGGGFVLSSDVVKKMTSHFNDTLFIKIDDAYIGELALKSGVDVIHDDRFYMSKSGCRYSNKSIVHHPVKSQRCMHYLFSRQLIGSL